MKSLCLLGTSFVIFCFSLLVSFAQEVDNWDVPVTSVGDSLDLVEDEAVIVTGSVTDAVSGEPISNASVSVNSFQHFDYSDQQGKYVLQLLPGLYKIKVRRIGMLPVYMRVRVISSGVLDITMKEGVVNLTEVVITSRPIDSNIRGSMAGQLKLNVQEIRSLPTLMGEVDIIKSLQLMPGVASVGEGSSGFNVRGGRTDQNLVLLNEVPVFNTTHALGFVSAFNQDVIKDFTLYKGNVPAQFGGRASSVLEISSRRGDFDKWKFQNSIGPISSRVTAEGPLKSGKTSLIVSGRASYADWVLRKVKDPLVKNSSAFFYDAFTGISHRFSENSTADINFYSSKDNFQFSDQFGYSWNNYIASGKWQGFANRKASPSVNVAYGHYQTNLIDPRGVDASVLTNTMNYFQLKPNMHYELNDAHDITAGGSIVGYFPGDEKLRGYRGNPAIIQKNVNKERGIELAFFANDEFKVTENLSINAGIRYSHFAQVGRDTVYTYVPGQPRLATNIIDTIAYTKLKRIKTYGGFEPRISFRLNLSPDRSIKVSYNLMRQYIHLISNTTAPTPIDLWQVCTQYLPPQVSNNFSVGYFQNIKDNRWETSAEVFYKSLDNLIEYKDFPSLYLNKHLETELLSGEGRAYGGELYVRRIKGKWTGWLSYTYSRTETRVNSAFDIEQVNGGKWYPSNYNKPHNANLVLNRRFKGEGALSLIFSFNSGRPFTAIESSYIVGSTVVPIYSERNKYQIPNYFRMDFSFTIGNIFRKVNDSLVVSVYNLLGRDNAYSLFYKRPGNEYFIPKAYRLSILGAAMPSVTYNFRF